MEGERIGKDEDRSMHGFRSSITVPLENVIRVPTDSVSGKQCMAVLHEAWKVVRAPLQKGELKIIVVKNRKLIK